MDIQNFSQLGIDLATLAILLLVVKYFIRALTKKDQYLKEIVGGFQKNVEGFNTTVNNHIEHETQQAQKQTEALNNLARTISALAIRSENKK